MLAAVRSILCLAMCNPAATDDTQQGGGNQEKLEALEAFVKKYPPQTDLDKALCQFLNNIYQSGSRCIRSNDASLLLIYEEFKKSYKERALNFLDQRGVDRYVSQELAEEASSAIWCYFLKTCHEFDVNYREHQSSHSDKEENFHITAVIKNKTFKRLEGWLKEKLAKEIYSTPQSLDQTIGESDEPLINTQADPNPEINPGFPTLSDLDNLPLGEMGFQPSPEIAAETQDLIDLIKSKIGDRVVARDEVSIPVVEIASRTIFRQLQSLDPEPTTSIAQQFGIREQGVYSIVNDEIRPILLDILCEQILVPDGHSQTSSIAEAIRQDNQGKLRKRCHSKYPLCNLQFIALRRLRMCCDPPQSFEDISHALQEQGYSIKAKQVQTFWEDRNSRRVLFQFISEAFLRPLTLRTYLFRDPEDRLVKCRCPKCEEINAQFLAIQKLVYKAKDFAQIYEVLGRERYAYLTYGKKRRDGIIKQMEQFWQEKCVPLIKQICAENNYSYPEDL